jgi:hypothetical protein
LGGRRDSAEPKRAPERGVRPPNTRSRAMCFTYVAAWLTAARWVSAAESVPGLPSRPLPSSRPGQRERAARSAEAVRGGAWADRRGRCRRQRLGGSRGKRDKTGAGKETGRLVSALGVGGESATRRALEPLDTHRRGCSSAAYLKGEASDLHRAATSSPARGSDVWRRVVSCLIDCLYCRSRLLRRPVASR